VVTRRELDIEIPRRLIQRQFPEWADLPIEPVADDGWDNRTFRLGNELSIRLPSGAWYAQQVEKEQRWLPVLAPRLPLPIPEPVARGEPDDCFQHPWSVYRWMDGEIASRARVTDPVAFAATLAAFLNALERVNAAGGPLPGEHNFFRGGPLAHYEAETLEAIAKLGDEIPRGSVERVWDDAMSTQWDRDPVWFHGDVAVGNLLVCHGRLVGVLDFGTSGTGDPACDLVIAWTYLRGEGRERFRADRGVDAGRWSRGRGWCLWKTLITLAGQLEDDAPDVRVLRREIDELIADHARDA
jgi:aminoglycoside phosphotransferase (APT) family kinase protein